MNSSNSIILAVGLACLLLGACEDRKKSAKPKTGASAVAKQNKAADTPPPASQPAPASQPKPTIRTFADAEAALGFLLRRHRPRVLGLGEYHQKKGGAKVASSIKRFSHQLLPSLATRASDLIVETWITTGNCGKVEKRVVRQVQKTTKRPKATENEVITLIRRADKLGVKPHILKVHCKDYRALLGKGKVDYAKLLKLTGDHLGKKIDEVRVYRRQKKNKSTKKMIVVYGGGLHNDLRPKSDFAPFSYAPRVDRSTKGDYLEIDLYVPEYIEGASTLVSEEPWFPEFRQKQSAKHALLIERSARSYIIVFRRTSIRKKSAAPTR